MKSEPPSSSSAPGTVSCTSTASFHQRTDGVGVPAGVHGGGESVQAGDGCPISHLCQAMCGLPGEISGAPRLLHHPHLVLPKSRVPGAGLSPEIKGQGHSSEEGARMG